MLIQITLTGYTADPTSLHANWKTGKRIGDRWTLDCLSGTGAWETRLITMIEDLCKKHELAIPMIVLLPAGQVSGSTTVVPNAGPILEFKYATNRKRVWSAVEEAEAEIVATIKLMLVKNTGLTVVRTVVESMG